MRYPGTVKLNMSLHQPDLAYFPLNPDAIVTLLELNGRQDYYTESEYCIYVFHFSHYRFYCLNFVGPRRASQPDCHFLMRDHVKSSEKTLHEYFWCNIEPLFQFGAIFQQISNLQSKFLNVAVKNLITISTQFCYFFK